MESEKKQKLRELVLQMIASVEFASGRVDEVLEIETSMEFYPLIVSEYLQKWREMLKVRFRAMDESARIGKFPHSGEHAELRAFSLRHADTAIETWDVICTHDRGILPKEMLAEVLREFRMPQKR